MPITITVGDFILETSHPGILSFKNNENFIKLVKGDTCLKGKKSCFELILTTKRCSFKYTSSTETGLSDQHHLISSIMKKKIEKKVVIYCEVKTNIYISWQLCEFYVLLEEFCKCAK